MGLITLVIFAGAILPSLSELVQESTTVSAPQFERRGLPCERHSLYYVYTALSKPIHAPNIFEFTGMGMLDDRKIDYYNSVEKIKKPEQPWMREKLPADYWEKGTQSRKSKEQWFKVNVNILMERKRQNNSDIHVLNWRHGCEIEKREDGTIKFVKGVDQYSYDGADFLSFDDFSMTWVAPVPEAEQTKQKWDGVPILNQYTKGYLEKECVEWLDKFMKYSEDQLDRCAPPEVYVFHRTSKTSSDFHTITCLATGFLPRDIKMLIQIGSFDVVEVKPTDVLPNGDGTHQARLELDVPTSDITNYQCYVDHRKLKQPIVKSWEAPCGVNVGIAVGGVFGGLGGLGVLVGVVLLIIYGVKACRSRQGDRTAETVSSEGQPLNPESTPADIETGMTENTNLIGSNRSLDSGVDGASTDSSSSSSNSNLDSSSGHGSDGSPRDESFLQGGVLANRTVERAPEEQRQILKPATTEEKLQQLKERVLKLMAENERLRQHNAPQSSPADATTPGGTVRKEQGNKIIEEPTEPEEERALTPEEELQQLDLQELQIKADNERLRQEKNIPPDADATTPGGTGGGPSAATGATYATQASTGSNSSSSSNSKGNSDGSKRTWFRPKSKRQEQLAKQQSVNLPTSTGSISSSDGNE